MKAFVTTSFIAATLLGAALTVAQPSSGHWGRHGAGMRDGGGRFAEALNLTDDQKAATRKIRDQLETKGEPLMQQLRQQRDDIETMLESGHPDATELGQKMIASYATRTQMKALHEEFETKFSALLNADQLAKFQELQSMRKRFRGTPGDPSADDRE